MTEPAPSPPRLATRAPVERPVRLQFDDTAEVVEASCRDISIGGMFVATPAGRPRGSLVRFELEVEEGSSIRGLAEVIWMRSRDGGEGREPGMGMKFRFLEQRDRQQIFKLVSQHIKDRLANRQPFADNDLAGSAPADRKAPANFGPPPVASGGMTAGASEENVPASPAPAPAAQAAPAAQTAPAAQAERQAAVPARAPAPTAVSDPSDEKLPADGLPSPEPDPVSFREPPESPSFDPPPLLEDSPAEDSPAEDSPAVERPGAGSPPAPPLPVPPAPGSTQAAFSFDQPDLEAPSFDPPSFDPPSFETPSFETPAVELSSLESESVPKRDVADTTLEFGVESPAPDSPTADSPMFPAAETDLGFFDPPLGDRPLGDPAATSSPEPRGPAPAGGPSELGLHDLENAELEGTGSGMARPSEPTSGPSESSAVRPAPSLELSDTLPTQPDGMAGRSADLAFEPFSAAPTSPAAAEWSAVAEDSAADDAPEPIPPAGSPPPIEGFAGPAGWSPESQPEADPPADPAPAYVPPASPSPALADGPASQPISPAVSPAAVARQTSWLDGFDDGATSASSTSASSTSASSTPASSTAAFSGASGLPVVERLGSAPSAEDSQREGAGDDDPYFQHLGEDHFEHRPAPRRDFPLLTVGVLALVLVAALVYLFGDRLFDWRGSADPAPASAPAPGSVDTAPVDTAPVDTAPVDTAPIDTAPADAASRTGGDADPSATAPQAAPPRAVDRPASAPSTPAAEPASRPQTSSQEPPSTASSASRPAAGAPSSAAGSAAGSGAGGMFRQLEGIRWQAAAGGLEVVLETDGLVPQRRVKNFRLEGPPREVIRLLGVPRQARPAATVGEGGVSQIRTGWHERSGENELHVVLDMSSPRAEVESVRVDGRAVIVRVVEN